MLKRVLCVALFALLVGCGGNSGTRSSLKYNNPCSVEVDSAAQGLSAKLFQLELVSRSNVGKTDVQQQLAQQGAQACQNFFVTHSGFTACNNHQTGRPISASK